MSKQYELKEIRILLTEGFTAEELRRLCYDIPDFRCVYDQLAQNTGKAEIIVRLLEFANQKLKIDQILNWAKEHNPSKYEEYQSKYEEYQSYDSFTPGVTISSNDQGAVTSDRTLPGMKILSKIGGLRPAVIFRGESQKVPITWLFTGVGLAVIITYLLAQVFVVWLGFLPKIASPHKPAARLTPILVPTPIFVERNETQILEPFTYLGEEYSMEMTLTGIEWAQVVNGSNPRSGNIFAIAHLRVKNPGPNAQEVGYFDFKALDANGSLNPAYASPTDCRFEYPTLTAGGTVEGCIGVEVPATGKVDLIYAPLYSLNSELTPDNSLSFNLRAEGEASIIAPTPTPNPSYTARNETQQLGPIMVPGSDNEHTWEVTLTGVEWAPPTNKNTSGKIVAIAHLRIKNISLSNGEVSLSDFQALDANGALLPAYASPRDCKLETVTLTAGGTTIGCVCLEVPEAGKLDLIYRPFMLGLLDSTLIPGQFLSFNLRP